MFSLITFYIYRCHFSKSCNLKEGLLQNQCSWLYKIRQLQQFCPKLSIQVFISTLLFSLSVNMEYSFYKSSTRKILVTNITNDILILQSPRLKGNSLHTEQSEDHLRRQYSQQRDRTLNVIIQQLSYRCDYLMCVYIICILFLLILCKEICFMIPTSTFRK